MKKQKTLLNISRLVKSDDSSHNHVWLTDVDLMRTTCRLLNRDNATRTFEKDWAFDEHIMYLFMYYTVICFYYCMIFKLINTFV